MLTRLWVQITLVVLQTAAVFYMLWAASLLNRECRALKAQREYLLKFGEAMRVVAEPSADEHIDLLKRESMAAVVAIQNAIAPAGEGYQNCDPPPLPLPLVNMHEDIMRLRAALEEISGYRQHLSFCEYEITEFCTCGMKQAADKCRAALEGF